MARGWDSKAVEDQIADAEADRAIRNAPVTRPGLREARARIASLELSRAGVQSRLASTADARYRVQLQDAIDHLDGQLRDARTAVEALGGEAGPSADPD